MPPYYRAKLKYLFCYRIDECCKIKVTKDVKSSSKPTALPQWGPIPNPSETGQYLYHDTVFIMHDTKFPICQIWLWGRGFWTKTCISSFSYNGFNSFERNSHRLWKCTALPAIRDKTRDDGVAVMVVLMIILVILLLLLLLLLLRRQW